MTTVFVFLMLSALGSYRTYHFTESVQFCGMTCHEVMKPEHTTYQNSPHARVACVECHIGSGAGWFVRSKLSGSYQVYSVLAHKYPKPIPTPVKNLRPAQDTCEACHWPQKFTGSVERINPHFLADETNTAWAIRLLMKVGGGNPQQGPIGGIHWHVSGQQKIDYIATDEARQKIPWVRVTGADGKTTVYQAKEGGLKTEDVSKFAARRMDCIDCHNRPAHGYRTPSRSVNEAIAAGQISQTLPFIKKNAVEVLTGSYETTTEALNKIEATLSEQYKSFANHTLVSQAITEVKKIYSNNFFPEMKADWRRYPSNIGHTVFPGCYRCHDGQHVSSEGKPIRHDCNLCHTILSQGQGEQLTRLSAKGDEFQHPSDIGDLWKEKESNCTDCHNGALVK
jgi:hypothetical protein